jgi:hypothetical protein
MKNREALDIICDKTHKKYLCISPLIFDFNSTSLLFYSKYFINSKTYTSLCLAQPFISRYNHPVCNDFLSHSNSPHPDSPCSNNKVNIDSFVNKECTASPSNVILKKKKQHYKLLFYQKNFSNFRCISITSSPYSEYPFYMYCGYRVSIFIIYIYILYYIL